jgi:hypothetical protein
MAKAKRKKATTIKPSKAPRLQPEVVNVASKTHKVADVVFWQVFAECGGAYAATARALVRMYPGLSYSRAAVQLRAMRYPEKLKEVRDKIVDDAEEALHDIINDDADAFGKAARVRAAMYVLDKRGKDRGYGTEKTGVNVNVNKGEGEADDTAAVSLTIKIAQ